MALSKCFLITIVLVFDGANRVHCGCKLQMNSEQDVQLDGFVFKSFSGVNLGVCFTECIKNRICQSINYNLVSLVCQFNSETRKRRPASSRKKANTVYMENAEKAKRGSSPIIAARSCKEIKELGELRDGEYWIDPENSGKPFTVYCDMTAGAGGWTLVKRYRLHSANTPSLVLHPGYEDYRAIANYSNNEVYPTSTAVYKLKSVTGFNQIRWRCHKKKIGRTIDIYTTNDDAGYKVIDHFLVKATWPTACNSFKRLTGDSSILAKSCSKWGRSKHAAEINRWGHYFNYEKSRMYNAPFLMDGQKKYVMSMQAYFRCDDTRNDNFSIGDSWEVYVR